MSKALERQVLALLNAKRTLQDVIDENERTLLLDADEQDAIAELVLRIQHEIIERADRDEKEIA